MRPPCARRIPRARDEDTVIAIFTPGALRPYAPLPLRVSFRIRESEFSKPIQIGLAPALWPVRPTIRSSGDSDATL